MKRNRDPRPIREQLAGAERGLQQIEKTRNKDDRRVMLGCLLFDLVAIEKAMAWEGCTAGEQARLGTLAGCPRWLLARKLVRAKILTVEDLRRKDDEELAAAGLDRREIGQCNRIVRKARRKAERA